MEESVTQKKEIVKFESRLDKERTRFYILY